MFGCVAYTMVPDVKNYKLDAKGTKCLFLDYYKGTKAYKQMCLQTKKIIKYRDVIFIEDNTSFGKDLDMHPFGSNKGPMVVVVEKPSKLSLCDDGDERKEQVGVHLI